MTESERIWARRLRWRFRGAWQWPTFVVATLLDGLILHLLPPTGPDFDPIFGIFVATFVNLFLIGAVAPWLAKRLHRRATQQPSALGAVPLEVVRDRTATALLLIGVGGLIAAGLGNREVIVSETRATEENQRLVRDYIDRQRSDELNRNSGSANSIRLEDGYFRTCIRLDDTRKRHCVFVDTKKGEVVRDPDSRRNEDAYPGK